MLLFPVLIHEWLQLWFWLYAILCKSWVCHTICLFVRSILRNHPLSPGQCISIYIFGTCFFSSIKHIVIRFCIFLVVCIFSYTTVVKFKNDLKKTQQQKKRVDVYKALEYNKHCISLRHPFQSLLWSLENAALFLYLLELTGTASTKLHS